MNTGKWKDTDLGNAFRAARDGKDPSKQYFFDFKPYAPSHGAPASFISQAVYTTSGRFLGVLVFQMPIERINRVMQISAGMGESGETYIVGTDHLMRSDSRFSEESTILKTEVTGTTVDAALAGEKGVELVKDYRGIPVFSAYGPIDFLGTRWAILAEIDKAEIAAPIAKAMWKTVGGTAIAVLIMAGISLLVARSLARPITTITHSMESLAAGDLETEVPFTDRGDEIGEMAGAVQIFKEKAQEAERLKQEQILRDQQAEEDKKRAMEELADKFETRVQSIIDRVANSATTMVQMISAVSQTIEGSSQTAQDAAVNATQANDNVQSVAAAVEEMSSAVREISSQTHRSNDLVSSSVQAVETADRHAAALSEASNKVREVVELIADIAGQINLLALNATIESARAGEAGKGFAVVAGEVKNLAGQTDRSIQEIEKVISEMTTVSDDIVSSLSHIKESISEIASASGAIAASVEEQSATTNEIAHNMQTASMGTERISQNISDVSTASSEANASAEQIEAAIAQLSQETEMLDQEVKQFLREIRT